MERCNGSDEIYLIGCSRSVLDLTTEERARINRAKCVMGLNKFVYFHEVAGILPTHVWFADNHPPSPRILGDIFEKCRREHISGMTFILSPYYSFGIRVGAVRYHLGRVRRFARRRRGHSWELFHAPNGCRYEYVMRHDDPDGGRWATRKGEPLYNLRTAFTSALNYLAIRHPGSPIRLVGTDFNTPGYFFEEQMRRRGLPWDDWTAAIQAEHGRHSAAIEAEGRTVFDGFLYMKGQLDRSGIRLTCNNPSSDTVLRGLADYAPILSATPAPGVRA